MVLHVGYDQIPDITLSVYVYGGWRVNRTETAVPVKLYRLATGLTSFKCTIATLETSQ